jgi:hypothetical protein
MDLTGLTALDVAIALAFLFFLLSTICAAINEMIAGLLGWRAQELEKALRNYVTAKAPDAAAPAEATPDARLGRLFDNPRIAVLIDHARNDAKPLRVLKVKHRSPSYLPPRAVALAMLDTFVGEKGEGSKDLIAPTKDVASKIPVEPLRTVVLDALAEGRETLEEVREAVETSFDEVMERCAGWYKRRAQKMILIIAAVVAIGLNVSTFNVADRVSKDDALRASVVEQASKSVATPGADEPKTTPSQEIAKQVDDVQQLGLPLGWSDANRPDRFLEWIWAALGWLATIAAISLGAPFWFDVLGKFSRLRNTGIREGTAKDDTRAPEDRDERRRAGRR